MKFLFSSSDPGSARQNNSVISYIQKNLFQKSALISTKIAYQFYSVDFDKKLIVSDNRGKNFKEIYDFIKSLKPNFIITGLSMAKNNIDFITCKVGNDLNIKTATIQDYYGHLGSFNKLVQPRSIFVIDDYAKSLIQKKEDLKRRILLFRAVLSIMIIFLKLMNGLMRQKELK